jgi:hypothetical protein
MAAVSCAPGLCAPDGPDIPFGPWPIVLYDLVRLFLALSCVGIFTLSLLSAVQAELLTQRARYVALMLFASVVLGTEIGHLGDDAHYRLWMAAVAVLMALWGLLGYFLQNEAPARQHDDPRFYRGW